MPRPMPDVNKKGILCEGCAARYYLMLMIPDDLWETIREGQNFLCGVCIVMRVEALDKTGALIADHYNTDKSPGPLWVYSCGIRYRTEGFGKDKNAKLD